MLLRLLRPAFVDGVKAELTPKEYEILFYFIKNKGIALTREKLLYDVWGFDFYGDFVRFVPFELHVLL